LHSRIGVESSPVETPWFFISVSNPLLIKNIQREIAENNRAIEKCLKPDAKLAVWKELDHSNTIYWFRKIVIVSRLISYLFIIFFNKHFMFRSSEWRFEVDASSLVQPVHPLQKMWPENWRKTKLSANGERDYKSDRHEYSPTKKNQTI